jgi:alkylation response protein AidB-like acyl-CoA dehydrogenase
LTGCLAHRGQLRPESGLSFDTKPIKTSYSAAAGTAYVTMDEVVVPPENLVGRAGQGFYQVCGHRLV